jgi:ankyrin repeat protein
MSKSRTGRLIYALIVLVSLWIVVRNGYYPYLNHCLIEAIEAENLPAVRTLLTWGADPNSRKPGRAGDPGFPALWLTIGSNYPLSRAQEEIACLLIRRGAIIRETATYYGSTRYLKDACVSGSLLVARCLLEHGADPNLMDSEASVPLDKALEYGTAVRSISGHRFTDVELTQRHRTSQALVQLLTEHGVRVSLWQAAVLNDRTALRAALDSGTPVDSREPLPPMMFRYARTPLLIAAEAGNIGAVRLLLDRGANVNLLSFSLRRQNGLTALSPLSVAVGRRHLEVARLLLARGADVNLKGSQGVGPLTGAAGMLPPLVPELLRRGADVNAEGGAPLCQAILHEQQAIVTLLVARGARVQGKPGTAALGAALRSMPQLVPMLLSKGADARGAERNYNSLIRLAVYYGRGDQIPLLIHAGANVNTRDFFDTALMEAIIHKPGLVKLLLDAGADPNAPNKQGMTPLMVAAEIGDAGAARLLLAHGATADAHPLHDHTALWYARRHNHPAVAALLDRPRTQ